jgi:hypothetical protein
LPTKEDIVHARFLGAISALVVITICAPTMSDAQGLTGQISGTITDAAGAVIPGATIVLVNAGTEAGHETVSDPRGNFVFPDLLAGSYNLKVSMSGFKTYEQTGIELSANERVALHQVVLEIGRLEEMVQVQAEAALVQTRSSERSGLITPEQLENIALKGRDYLGMVRLLPGVVDTANREAPGWNNLVGLSVNGRGSLNLTYDGVTNLDTGSNVGPYAAPGLDSIAEIKVLTSNYQAEYGRSSGGTINVVTKSGTRDFHGSAYYFKRDTALNSNEWQRNKQGLPTAPYAYDNTGYTVGGPVLIPGSDFNRGRNKLFFFWSEDLLPRTDPGTLNFRTVPTALERRGDFSQSVTQSGTPYTVIDPQTGKPFPGNVILQNRIDPNGQALLNLLPLPNTTDPTGRHQYNYQFQSSLDHPRTDQVLRVDWNVTSNTTFYSRLQFGYEAFKGQQYFLGGTNLPQLATNYSIDTLGLVNTLLHTFNSTTFLEVTGGVNHSHQQVAALASGALDSNDRTKVLNNLPQFYPQANPLHLIPNAIFGSNGQIANQPQLNLESRFPFFGRNNIWNISSNLSKLMGAHTAKAGVFVEYTMRPAARASSFNGTFGYGVDNQNPFDSRNPFANAVLGSIASYTESNIHPSANGRFTNTEWFVQDNWQRARRFSLDYGIRFYYIAPTRSQGDKVAMFDPSAWQAASAPLLIQPVSTPQGRRGLNPLTGQVVPAVLIGTLVPGSGDPNNGMKVFDGTVMATPPIQVAPRIGFAWDLRGDGKTAIRGGAGVFPDRFVDDEILQLVEQPPLVTTVTAFYTTMPQLLATPASLSPVSVRSVGKFQPPVVYNYSIGLQRNLGLGMIADVAYVGNRAEHQLLSRSLNAVPYGTTFQPSALDPTNNNQPLPLNFLRPYRGYGDITLREFSGYGRFNSLQISLNRGGTGPLLFGLSYTFAKSRNLGGNLNPFLDPTTRNLTYAGPEHTLTVHYSYDIPSPARFRHNAVTRHALAGWQISGVTSYFSGSRGSVSYSITGVTNLTGGGGLGVDSRVDFTCDPNLPAGDQTIDRYFRTECVAPPSLSTNRAGTSHGDELTLPGYVNSDISLFRNIRLGGTRRLQFRAELYNALNQSQFATVDTAAVFDQTGKQTSANFGRVTAMRDARRIQLGLRLSF